MRRTNWLAAASALAFAATWSLATVGSSADDTADKAKQTENSAKEQATSRDQRSNQQQSSDGRGGRSDDENARHHAALGVSLAESDGQVRVVAVLPGSPAAQAGLQAGDQIRYVGDQRIRTAQGLAEEIGEYRPDSQVELSIRRDGEKKTLTARLASQESTFRNRERWNRGNNDQSDNRWNNERQANRANRAAYSYGTADGQADAGQLGQQVRMLQQQVARLQQQVNQLQANQGGNRDQNGRTQDGRNFDRRQSNDWNGQQNRAANRGQQYDRDEDLDD
jgi:hypothetical protein